MISIAIGKYWVITALIASGVFAGAEASGQSGVSSPQWSGRGAYRVVVVVPPVETGSRVMDESVAAFPVDFGTKLREAGVRGYVDLSTLQVHRYDVETGDAMPFHTSNESASPYDRPCRYDDNVLPEDYPSRVGRASETEDGRAGQYMRPRKGRLFNRLKDRREGRLIWVHTQERDKPSHYAIYFDVSEASDPLGISPAPWIGDVDVLRRAEGQPLGGFSHFSVATGDLNSDGLFDLIAGTEKGDIVYFPNRGAKGKPYFDGSVIIFDEEGPIDTGWYASPLLYDFDADGLIDLVVGTSGNVLLWWKNTGTPEQATFAYRGFVQADGGRLELPETPVAEDPNDIFKRDYYNQPWIGDFDGDGQPDLITGGYTTGRVFHYRGDGKNAGGTPRLSYRGEVQADGKPVDTIWAAAPCAYDFDDDGDLDLVSGAWWWSGIADPPGPGDDDYLMYFRNDGDVRTPKLSRTDLPRDGEFPDGQIARPTAVDWNEDGLIDLLVSDASGQLWVFLNRGTRSEPRWDMDVEPLAVPWGFMPHLDFNGSWADFDGDGIQDVLAGTSVRRITGSAYAPEQVVAGRVMSQGKPIDHPGPGYGDPYYYTCAADWDKDGLPDILWGTHQGGIFLHKGIDDGDPRTFKGGVELKLTTGEPLRLGPAPVGSAQEAKDFTVLQGSRIVFLVTDFDGDGIDDIVATETYGNIWVFLNTRSGGTDTLLPGVKVATMSSRADAMNQIDWNRDGLPDLLTGGTAARPGMIFMNQSTRGKPAIADPVQPIEFPYLFWGPRLRSVDWNGDGDEDLLINSEFFSFWAERSFLEHGYINAEPLRIGGAVLQTRAQQESSN